MPKLSPSEFWSALKKGAPAPVYLVHGDDQRLVDKAYKAIESLALAGGQSEFNADYFHGRDADPAQILAAANTMPMLADRRLVAVRHIEGMKTPKDPEAPAKATTPRDRILKYLESPNPTTVLLLHAGALDLRKGDGKLETAAAKAGVSVHFPKPKAWKLTDAIVEMARERGRRMDQRAAEALAELAGDDMLALEQELEKVILYRGDRKVITREDVLEAVADIKETVVFAFTDAIAGRDGEGALIAFRRLADQGNEPLATLGMLARHFRLVWKMQEYRDRNQTAGVIARDLHLSEWVVKEKYLPWLEEFPASETGRIMTLIADLDIKLKSTRTDKDVLFERAIMDLCSSRLR
jgi:DNA polymerase-3 subunit delta